MNFFSLRQKTKSQEGGFTLLELLVLILVIGILAAIAIPIFLNQRSAAQEAALKSDLKNAGTLLEGQGKFTGTLPADLKTSKGVMLTAMRTSERDNKVASSQFVDGNSSRWGTFVSPTQPVPVTTQVFTNPGDGYQNMNYRRITVNSGTSGAVGQNVNISLPSKGIKGDTYTVSINLRHNYTGCRTLFLEFKNAAGEWPGGITNKQICFQKDEWTYFESTGSMNGDGSDYVYMSMFGSMTAGNTMDATGAAMVKGTSIDSSAALSTTGGDFCVQGYHENDTSNIWRYSSLDGGVANKSC